MNEEKQIEGSIIHVMNLIIIELLRYGFMLAHENELKDLKDLVNTDEQSWMRGDGLICLDEEMELLDGLADVVVKQIMCSVNKLTEFKDTYLLINSLDRDEVIMDTEFYEHAQDTFYTYSFEMECDGTYENILENLHSFYWPVDMILFHCIMQFVHGKLEVIEEAQETYHNHYCAVGFELPTENKNALLLLDLMPLLNEDAEQIDAHYRKITKEN